MATNETKSGKPKIGSRPELDIYRIPKEKKFKDRIWNKEKREFLGRNRWSWGEVLSF